MAELPGAMALPTSMGVCIVFRSTGLLSPFWTWWYLQPAGTFFLAVEILLVKIALGKEIP